MPRSANGFDSGHIAVRWLALADRRLLYFSELYRSGRWTRYYATPELFAEQMHKALRAAQTWARLAGVPRQAGGGDAGLYPAE
jgi:uncharacterized repeat protein (TIGR03809 family)